MYKFVAYFLNSENGVQIGSVTGASNRLPILPIVGELVEFVNDIGDVVTGVVESRKHSISNNAHIVTVMVKNVVAG